MEIPKDPYILVSYINTQLRDNYADLEDLCLGLQIDPEDLIDKLRKVNFEYRKEQNQFL